MPLITSLGLQPISTDYDPPPGPHAEHLAWSAIFPDLYDGAPDAGHQLVGWGRTEREAIIDLLEQADEQVLDAVGDLPAHPAHLACDGPPLGPQTLSPNRDQG